MAEGQLAPAPTASAPPRPVEQSDLQIAQSVYGTGPRTPAEAARPAAERLRLRFDDAREERQCRCNCRCPRAALRAVHRRLEPGARVVRAQRTARAAVFDLVETSDDPRCSSSDAFAEAIRRSTCARVFKCAYLDRSDANLRDSAGPAGQLNRRPLTAAELRDLSEYLWQFRSTTTSATRC